MTELYCTWPHSLRVAKIRCRPSCCPPPPLITAQGDGTVLHLASLFESDEDPLPPVMSFSMGTLGFLTPFDVNHYERLLTR